MEACERHWEVGKSQEAMHTDNQKNLDLTYGHQLINVFVEKVLADICFALHIDILGDAFKNI